MIDENLLKEMKKAQKDLEEYSKSMQPSASTLQAIKSAMNIDKSILELAKKQDEEAKKYAQMYGKTVEDLVSSQASLKSTQNLLSLAESVNKDNFKIDIDELSNQHPKFDHIEYNLPDIRNYAQEMLDSLDLQRETLIKIVNHTEEQNSILKQQISLNQESSLEQGKDNRKAIYITMFVAVVSIIVSLYSVDLSVKKSEEIFQKENISTTKQNIILNKKLDNINPNNNNMEIIKNTQIQINILNKILEEIKNNEKRTK